MDFNFKRVDPSLLYSLLDPFFYNDLWSKIHQPSLSPSKQTSASCENFLSPSPKERLIQLRQDDSHSLNILDTPSAAAGKWVDTGKEVTVIRDAVSLLSDIINYLMCKLIPCTRRIGAIQYNDQCFYGYEAVSVLTVYVQATIAGMGPPFPRNKIELICSRFLVSGIFKDARKSENLEFKSSKLYRFSSKYIRNHTLPLSDNYVDELPPLSIMRTPSTQVHTYMYREAVRGYNYKILCTCTYMYNGIGYVYGIPYYMYNIQLMLDA